MTDAPTAPRRRGRRPGLLSSLQQRQRATSRDAIVAAVVELLAEKPFDEISVEEILQRAPSSRATYYRHFKARRDLALAVYETIFSRTIGHFDALRDVAAEPDRAVAWVERLAGYYREGGRASVLIMEMGVVDAAFHQRLREDRLALIARLGATIPAFARSLGETPRARGARVRADLLLLLIDRVCVEVAAHGDLPDAGAYVAAAAADLRAFLSSP